MPIKPHIFNSVSPAGIRARIPPEFHKLLDESLLRATHYTVISFPGMRGESTSIVDSKSLSKALRKPLPVGDHLVVVAHDFTAEARDILCNLNAVCVSASDFYWTDESWTNTRDK